MITHNLKNSGYLINILIGLLLTEMVVPRSSVTSCLILKIAIFYRRYPYPVFYCQHSYGCAGDNSEP